MDNKSPNVAIFRKRILPYSETFIADQGGFLESYKAVFTGFSIDSTGLGLIGALPRCVLEEQNNQVALQKLLFRLSLFKGGNWVESLRAYNPKLIHAHFLSDGIDAIRLARFLAVPVITTLHGHDITKPRTEGRLKRESKYFFRNTDRVIAVSDYIAQHALAKGCPDSKLIKHSIGIDLNRFNQEKLETEWPSLLFVGRLVEKKGCTYLLQAMNLLKKKFPELSLTVVGDGVLKSVLQQQANDFNLKVSFVGKQTAGQIKDWLAKSWLFVAPSITAENGDAEGLGMVFLEAQALETPVVSFRSGGIAEAVDDENTGLLCEEKDILALAENIESLLGSESLRRKMGRLGRERVEMYFDVRKQCLLLESIYDDVCRKG